MVCFSLALKLKMPVQTVMNLPYEEIRDWCAYFEVLEQRRKNK